LRKLRKNDKVIEKHKNTRKSEIFSKSFSWQKKKKNSQLSGFSRLREKIFGKKKKKIIRGVKMHI
jgi:hypothetical protein